jgi:hypothetical protein
MSEQLTEIRSVVWGRMEVAAGGLDQVFKDCKIWPGTAKEWDWRTTGTRHVPGIQVADVEEILASGVSVIVLSRGMDLMLNTCPETVAYIVEHGVDCRILETKEAVREFNELSRAGVGVGGLFHSTC